METSQPTPASIWKFTNQTARALDYGRQFLMRLESGQISQPALNRLEKYMEPGPEDILSVLGRRGAAATRNPARASEHYRLIQLLGQLNKSIVDQFWDRTKADDADNDAWLRTFTPKELAAIAAKFGPKILEFTKTKLETEAEAAATWIENQAAGTKKSVKQNAKPGGAESGNRKPTVRIKAEVRALAALQNDTSIALKPNPIAKLAKLVECDARTLRPGRAPTLHKALDSFAKTDPKIVDDEQADDEGLEKLRRRRR